MKELGGIITTDEKIQHWNTVSDLFIMKEMLSWWFYQNDQTDLLSRDHFFRTHVQDFTKSPAPPEEQSLVQNSTREANPNHWSITSRPEAILKFSGFQHDSFPSDSPSGVEEEERGIGNAAR